MKRTVKTLLISALCICMLLAATPNLGSPVFAAEIVDSGYCGGEGDGTNLTWTLDSDGLLTISGTGEMGDYGSVQDEEASENITTAPWGGSYANARRVKTILVRSGVTSIGNNAFEGCTRLTEVTIGNGVTSIGEYAFYGCTSLTSVTIPDSVMSIGGSAFSRCTSLTGITVSNNNACFTSESGVLFNKRKTELIRYPSKKTGSHYSIPDCVTRISMFAFADCTSLTSVAIPDSVTVIESAAFSYCTSLTSVTIPDSVTSIWTGAFAECTSLTSVAIGNSVTSIPIMTFFDCVSLTSVTIPDSVTHISSSAFLKCTSLKDVYYYGSQADWQKILIDSGDDVLKSANIHFMEKRYTVSYNPNGGTGTPSVQTKTQNATLTLSTLVPTKSFTISYNANGGSVTPASKTVSCTFRSWNTQQNGSGTAYAPGASYNANADATLYAQWTNPTVGNLPTPTRDGYTFDGWYTAASGGTRVMASDTISDIAALYAHWTRKTPDQPTPDSGFVWGRDNWNFINSNYNGDFASTSYRSQLGADYLNVLRKNLTNKEYQYIFNGYGATSAWLDKKWSGSCYGMSSLTLLAKQGLMPFSQYGAGAASLFSLTRPTENAAVRSLITYYQMLQIKDVIQQQYRTVPLRTNEANIKEILSLLDANPTVLVGFRKDGWGGHAVLAYRYEYGSFTYNGVTYQGCIRICDPNASKAYDANHNIYFNTQTYQWAIPAYQSSGISSALGAKFNYVGANVNEINAGGYLSGATEQKIADYISRIDAYSIGNNRSVSKVEQADGAYVTMNTAPGDIVEDYSYILGNASDGVIGYTLMDSASAYMVTQNEPIALDVHMDYENSSLSAVSAAGKRVIFDPNGVVEVNGESAAYTLSMTFDGGHPTDWFAVEVKGGGANHASLTKAADGYILTADNLQNVTVNVNNRDHAAALTFSAAYPAVLIYEINADTVGVKVDTDNNGTYDTDLSDVASFTPGDVDADGKVTASDARLALRCAVGLEHYAPGSAQFLACDVDGDKKVTASDARLILRAAVGLETLK